MDLRGAREWLRSLGWMPWAGLLVAVVLILALLEVLRPFS